MKRKRTLLQTRVEPVDVQAAVDHLHLKGMLDCDLETILLAQKSTDERAGLVAKSISGDIVGDCEEDEGMEGDVQAGI